MIKRHDAVYALLNRLCAIVLVAGACASPASAQDPFARAAAQVEALAAAPHLEAGTVTFPEAAMRESAYAWLQVPKDGLYTLRLSTPGSLALMSFANESGDYDGKTKPTQHALEASFSEAPRVGPVLLSARRKFLVGVGGQTSSELFLETVEQFDQREPMPEAKAEIADGSRLFALDADIRMILPATGSPQSIEVFAEAQAPSNATLDGQLVPQGGLFPWLTGKPSELVIRRTGKDPSPSIVLVRIGASDAGLDEREPNQQTANVVNPPEPFRGVILPQGDIDVLSVKVSKTTAYRLSIGGGAFWANFVADLRKSEEKGPVDILHRTGAFGSVDIETLVLDPGVYELALRREDSRPEVAPYVLTFSPTDPPAPGSEIEPNDTIDAATPLIGPLAVSGTGGNGDADIFSFSVPDEATDHLWRIISRGAARLRVFDRDRGTVVELPGSGEAISLDSLALVPGTYFVEVVADGEYRLRIRDLGERPGGFEGEPNDTQLTAQRLQFGSYATGSFHRTGDVDRFTFGLATDTDVEFEVFPPAEGATLARLFLGNRKWGGDIVFDRGADSYSYHARLPAGEWTLRMQALDGSTWSAYQVVARKLAATASGEPDDAFIDAGTLPLTGDISGSAGGFDAVDHVKVPLPEGEGTLVIACDRADERIRWSVWDWRLKKGELTGNKLATSENEMLVVPFTPDLGGAVRLQIDGGPTETDYACKVRFTSVARLAKRLESAERLDGLTLAAGTAGSADLASETRPVVALDLPSGDFALLGCHDAAGSAVDLRKSGWQVRNSDVLRTEIPGGFVMLRAKDAPDLMIRKSSPDPAFDAVTCALAGIDDLPRPADTGPPAEFRPIEEATGKPLEGAPTSPGLDALIARPAPPRQPVGALPVDIEFSDVPELAAYVETGQSFRAGATLSNKGKAEVTLDVAASGTEPGWRVSASPKRVALAPDQSATIEIDVTAAPWQSPVTSPSLVLRASDGVDFVAQLTGVPLDPSIVPAGPVAYWDAPESLRGGLNVLHFALGARVEIAGGKKLAPKAQDALQQVHDGIAPHKSGLFVEPQLEFRLAAPAVLAGVMIQLRSTSDSDRWPAEVVLEVSGDGKSWQPAARSKLATTHVPQYIVFEAPMPASYLRVTLPRCNQPCQKSELQEIQAIAVPGTHPEGLPPINAADLALGGHVIFANPTLGGNWNQLVLTRREGKANSIWNAPDNRHRIVVGFHQNRAALLDAVAWIGHPADKGRIEATSVAISVEGPAGPWTEVGTLPAPPIGAERTELRFENPVWARYLRLTLDRADESRDVGPDAIEAIEHPGTSVLGLWEDDQPRAAYEWATGAFHKPAHSPAGGPDRENAVDLTFDVPIASSVVMERNDDWWRVVVPEGPPRELNLSFGSLVPDVAAELFDRNGDPSRLETSPPDGKKQAVLNAGEYFLRIYEPPRSVMLSWDTSGSVGPYIPRTLAAVRTWARALQPGRDALNLLPFGQDGPLLPDFAESHEEVAPALRQLEPAASSDAEAAMTVAAKSLARRDGARGVVILTDAEAPFRPELWPVLMRTMPRVVSLSMDSDSRNNSEIMMDWAALNKGRFLRVMGPLGLADGLDMAAALFRAPKSYEMTASMKEYVEPEGIATLLIEAVPQAEDSPPTGAIELILDASGSMLQRMEGKLRIEVAHAALVHLVEDVLPSGVPFAFRAFGLEKDACRTELRVPLSPLDRSAAARSIRAVPAINLARTAIADSLLAAGEDLRESGEPRVIVLVTDGEETCDGDPAGAIESLRTSGLNVRINIVGFAIDDAALAQTFEAWAKIGGGSYFRADSPAALEAAVGAALTPQFEITRNHVDGTKEGVGNAALGTLVSVPAGSLTVAPGSGATGGDLTLRVQPGGEIKLTYDPIEGLRAVEEP